MRLYDLSQDQGVKIHCECSDDSKFIVFHHVDGMYSYCTTEKGGVIHLSASTPVRKREDGDYDIGEEPEEV